MRLSRRERRAVSPVIAELLLIVITVAIGTLVYSFASTAFGGFGAGFSNLVFDAGSQLTENVVVEQVFYFHSGGTCAGECSGTMFIGNSGSNTAVINVVYVEDVSNGSVLTSPKDIQFSAEIAGTYSPVPAAMAGCSASCYLVIQPGQTLELRFNSTSPLVYGSTYAFTLITARGNQIVAYEQA